MIFINNMYIYSINTKKLLIYKFQFLIVKPDLFKKLNYIYINLIYIFNI